MQIDVGSDNDDNSSDETLSIDKTRPASLDKMIALVATLVERSRGPDLRLQLSPRDYNAIAGGKVNSRKYLLKYFTDPYFIYKPNHCPIILPGFSIFIPTNQRQYQSASNTAFDSCSLSLG